MYYNVKLKGEKNYDFFSRIPTFFSDLRPCFGSSQIDKSFFPHLTSSSDTFIPVKDI